MASAYEYVCVCVVIAERVPPSMSCVQQWMPYTHTVSVASAYEYVCVCLCVRCGWCVYVNADRVPPSLSCVQQRMPYTHS